MPVSSVLAASTCFETFSELHSLVEPVAFLRELKAFLLLSDLCKGGQQTYSVKLAVSGQLTLICDTALAERCHMRVLHRLIF